MVPFISTWYLNPILAFFVVVFICSSLEYIFLSLRLLSFGSLPHLLTHQIVCLKSSFHPLEIEQRWFPLLMKLPNRKAMKEHRFHCSKCEQQWSECRIWLCIRFAQFALHGPTFTAVSWATDRGWKHRKTKLDSPHHGLTVAGATIRGGYHSGTVASPMTRGGLRRLGIGG